MKYYLLVLGCQMNLSDSERVKAVMGGMGYTQTDKEDEADLLGVISCSVRQKPIDRAYGRIRKWNMQKNRKSLITFVSGCILPDDKKEFLKLFDFVFDMSELNEFPQMLNDYGVTTPALLKSQLNTEGDSDIALSENAVEDTKAKPVFTPVGIAKDAEKKADPRDIFTLWDIKPDYDSEFEAYVPIQNGCDKFCTYCAVPYTRGREVSRPSGEIVEEVVRLINAGYKSITLLGQNVNSYGLDTDNEISFAQLLEKIGEAGNSLDAKCWVYFTSPHPRDMTRDVIEAIAKYKILAKQIHLPLQSGDDAMLEKMNRKHDVEKYRGIIRYIKELIPQATLFTDIIVGFTDETDAMFDNTMLSFDEFKYNMAYIAMYSPRPGAKSYKWADNISKEVKVDRFERLTVKLKEHTYDYNKTLIGSEIDVLVRGVERKTGYMSGHNEGKIVTRVLSKDTSLIGKIVRGRVTEASILSITVELI